MMDNRIETLRRSGILFGTSSWKYPGWQGLIYSRNYPNEKIFKEKALEEYSTKFSAVGVDHSYYAVPTPRQLLLYSEQTPSTFKFVFKAPAQATVFEYPNIARFGKNAGSVNPYFLDIQSVQDTFINPLKALGSKVGAMIFEFSKFRIGTIESGAEFVRRLDIFLNSLRKTTDIPIAIEIRNKSWLVKDYFKVLINNNVSHVFNSWTEMPEISKQWELASPYELSFHVLRLLLRPGTSYASAVNEFFPYDQLHKEWGDIRNATAQIIEASMNSNKTAFVLVNNRFEGCAPKTIDGILDLLQIRP